MTKRKAAEAARNTQKQHSTTDRTEQQRRLLAALQLMGPDGVTTIEARDELNVMHPAARIMELRARGYQIATIWTDSTNAQGFAHRNARYILLSMGQEGAA